MNSSSLTEMLLVIAIIAILSAEGIYRVREANNTDVREYCKNLNGHLNNLYLESRFRRQEIKITFDVDKNNIVVAKSDNGNNNGGSNGSNNSNNGSGDGNNNDSVGASKAKLSGAFTPPPNIKIASAKFSTINNQGQTLVFNGSVAPGSSAANNGTVIFEDRKDNKKCSIVQSLYGARRIE